MESECGQPTRNNAGDREGSGALRGMRRAQQERTEEGLHLGLGTWDSGPRRRLGEGRGGGLGGTFGGARCWGKMGQPAANVACRPGYGGLPARLVLFCRRSRCELGADLGAATPWDPGP